MRPRPRVALIVGMLLTVGCVTLLIPAPVAQAQQQAVVQTNLNLSVEEIQGDRYQVPIPPGTTKTFTLQVNYSWGAGGFSLDPTEIRLSAAGGAGWMEATLNDTLVYADVPTAPGPPGSTTVPVRLDVTISEDAPSFDPDFLFLAGTARANAERGNLDSSNHEPTPQVAAGALPQVDVTPSQKLVQLRGGERLIVPVEVENTGNVGVVTRLGVRDVPDGLQATIPGQVEVPLGETRSVDMVVRSSNALSSLEGEFVVQAQPRWSEDADRQGPTTQKTVIVGVRSLPSAVLLGQQTMGEVFLFTAIFVLASFVVGWPMTDWWETRRKAKGRAPIGASRDSRSTDDGDRDTSSKDRSTVHGIPRKGDDYVVIDDDEVFESSPPSGTVHGIPRRGEDYEVVDDDEFFD